MMLERTEQDAEIVSGRRVYPSPEIEPRILAALLRIEDQNAAILDELRAARAPKAAGKHAKAA